MTWNNKVAYMRAIFNHVFLHDLVALKNNPFNGVIVRPDVKRKKTLTQSEIKKIYLIMEAREREEHVGIMDKSRKYCGHVGIC
ncbi:hypothetical protein [Yersinia similis]|uniref:hypothetical protein n=1 Tax=Yersinia similis TaxID=367190 RepID=UPI00061C8222|nr:hypothetical protein [Yersinia similis]CNC49759.1 phage integrase [Yersinia similis]